MVKFSLAEARRAFRLEGFKFFVYVVVPIGIGVYYSIPEHWTESLTTHEPLETSEEAERRAKIREMLSASSQTTTLSKDSPSRLT
jgi:hypothetical protein